MGPRRACRAAALAAVFPLLDPPSLGAGICDGNSDASGTPLATVRFASGLLRPLFVTAPPGDADRLPIVKRERILRLRVPESREHPAGRGSRDACSRSDTLLRRDRRQCPGAGDRTGGRHRRDAPQPPGAPVPAVTECGEAGAAPDRPEPSPPGILAAGTRT